MTTENEVPRNVVLQGDSAKVLRMLPPNSVDLVCADPPYGLSSEPNMREVLWNWLHGAESGHEGKGFMQKDWDSFVPGPNVWKQIMRVLKPGGHIFSFSGTRTFDMMVTAMRLAGAEVRDKIDVLCSMENAMSWVYGCLSEDTEVLVDGQWVPYGMATKGKLALAFDIKSGKFEWMPIQETFMYQYDDTAYHIHSEDTDQIVSKNHKCVVGINAGLKFVLAESLVAEEVFPVASVSEKLSKVSEAKVSTMTKAVVSQEHYKGIMWCIRVQTGAFVAIPYGTH